LISDPVFYLAAVPAILIFGISKGGFGGGLGIVAVPLMALVVSPLTAAAILLPILCLMDVFSLWAYRGRWSWPELQVLLPASLLGIAAGALSFGALTPAHIRLLLGGIAIVFTLLHWSKQALQASQKPAPRGIGALAAAAAGFTSFVAHAGAPPVTMYLLRRNLDRTRFVATTVAFFALVNFVKLLPYTWLGQFDASNLATSLVLAPLAPLGIAIGVSLHKRVSEQLFFHIAWTLLFVIGIKLVYDGITGL
jgi:uncharacterized protein